MELVYRKSPKGINEIVSRTDGLALKLRPYLIVVDGNKTVIDLVRLNPGLKDIPNVLANLHDEGFLATDHV
jgi:hypothetical protein